MAKRFAYRVGWRRYVAGPMRVKDFIALLLASQDIARGGCAAALYAAYGALAQAIADMTHPRPDLSNVPLRRLFLLALVLREQLMPAASISRNEDAKHIAATQLPRYLSREELMVPVLRMAVLAHMNVDELLDMEMERFSMLLTAGEAAWAGIKLELVDVVGTPHFTADYRSEVVRELQRPIERIKPEDWNPWREHIRETAKRLRMAPAVRH